jgi:membrane associated rhomboid family serine protease
MVRLFVYVAAFALFGAVVSGFAGFWLGDLALDLRAIRPNANIDDDAMIIYMGIAFAGAAIGFVGGGVFGWRFGARKKRR